MNNQDKLANIVFLVYFILVCASMIFLTVIGLLDCLR